MSIESIYSKIGSCHDDNSVIIMTTCRAIDMIFGTMKILCFPMLKSKKYNREIAEVHYTAVFLVKLNRLHGAINLSRRYIIHPALISLMISHPHNGNIFRVTGPLCGEFTGYRKGQWRGALVFSLTCTNVWANNRDAGDLRRHRAHYGVAVMLSDVIPGLSVLQILLMTRRHNCRITSKRWLWHINTILMKMKYKLYTHSIQDEQTVSKNGSRSHCMFQKSNVIALLSYWKIERTK